MIVVKSPTLVKSVLNMVGVVNLGLLTYKGEEFGVKHDFEKFLRYYYNSDMKAFLADRRKLAQEQRKEILVVG